MRLTAPLGRLILAVAASLSAPADGAAQNPGGRNGLFVAVPAPLTSEAVTRIKKRVDDARNRGDQRPATVVFDFNPGGKDAAADDFGVCYSLARYVADLHDVGTVAFVHHKLSGHLALPALACKDLAVGAAAAVGDVTPPAGKLTRTEANGYDEILGHIRPSQAAVARKMADPDVQLRKGRKAGGVWYLDLRDRAAAEKDGVVVTDTAPLPAAPDGRVSLLTAAQLRDLGIARTTAEDRKDLADTYNLSAASLRDDPLAGRQPVAFRYVLRGPIDPGVREAVRRVAEKVLRDRGNVLVLQLDDAGGGDFQAALDLAGDLRKFQADDGLFSVAFVPNRAPDTAAVVALGCSEIVMSRRKDAAPGAGADTPSEAELGDFEQFLAGGRRGPPPNVPALAASLRDLAESQGYPPLVAEGMVNRDAEIVRARAKTDRAKRRLMTAAEFEADKANWESDGVLKPKGQLLKLPASQAEQLGVARYVVDARDPGEVYARYGVEPAQVRDATPAWLDRFAHFLKLPPVTVLLVVIGFTGLILELKVPGTTVPGVVAALCFILVFWAHTQFSGQLAVLSGMLFVLGLVLLMVEVFVTPGFGAAGISGILLMLASLALVTVSEVPQSSEEWTAFGGRMTTYLAALAVGLAVALFLGRYIESIPYANMLMLTAPDDGPGGDAVPMPGAAQAAGLLGAVGTAVTVLRPAGSVRFGDEYVDVVTEGGFVPAGARVQVVEVEGNRIVVKEV